MKNYGIDITQHKEFSIAGELNGNNEFCFSEEKRNDVLPAAILPKDRHEGILLTSTDKNVNFSRGLGLFWPRDAQIPIGGNDNWKNGIGRVPLFTCLSNIKAAGDAEEWKFIDSQLGWTPHVNQGEIFFQNAKLIARIFDKITSIGQSCFVIPEGFTESSQQTLLEAFPENTYLVPRSIALALKWSQEHHKEFQNVLELNENSKSLGHLVCASLGLGEWEVTLIEILAVREKGGIRLVPIYDPTLTGQGLEFCGIALCAEMINHKKDNNVDQEVWFKLCNTHWFEELIIQGKAEKVIDSETQKRLAMILLDPSPTRIPYPKLEIMKGLQKQHFLRGSLLKKISETIQGQKKQIHGFKDIIGIAAGGCFAAIPIQITEDSFLPDNPYLRMDMRKLKEYVDLGIFQAQRVYQNRLKQQAGGTGNTGIAEKIFSELTKHHKPSIYKANAFAEGASMAAYCIANGLPSFRIKLVPLHLYSVKPNLAGDKEEKWECLAAEGTIPAGETYHQPTPIIGLSIPEGKEQLELTLRRPGMNHAPMYRSVIAKIPQKTERKEPVIITANVRPGQGFAKVNINSQRHGIFSTKLDWQTMKTVSKPELKLEYIPNVAFIVSDPTLWSNAQVHIEIFIKNREENNVIDDSNIDDIRNALNKWRHDKASSNIFRHIGPINSDGNSNLLNEPNVLFDFCNSLESAWLDSWELTGKNRLLRVGGWLYLYMPKKMKEDAERNINAGTEKAHHLHVAGLTFHTDEQFKLFYRQICTKPDPSAEWFRALRNMVRFRDNALSDEIATNEQINHILSCVIRNLKLGTPGKRKYNNCIESLIYLLKRRRYHEDFLAPGDNETIFLRSQLKHIMETHPTDKYQKIARETLAFLNRIATTVNLTAILEADGDDDDE